MTATLTYDYALSESLSEVMEDLKTFVSNIQKPDLNDEKWADFVNTYGIELAERFDEIKATCVEKGKEYHESMEDIVEYLKQYSQEITEKQNIKKLNTMYNSLANSYEELLANLHEMHEQGLQVKRTEHLKPINYTRNLFHITCCTSMALAYEFVLGHDLALLMLGITIAIFGSLEISRKFSKRWNDFLVDKLFGMIARPHERHHINGSTYMMAGLFLIVLLFGQAEVTAAVLVLGLADPLATITGKKWGKKKLYKEKSYVGVSVFIAVAFSITLGFIFHKFPEFSTGYKFLAAGVLAVVSASAELFSTKIDDNFSIPVACAAAAWLMF